MICKGFLLVGLLFQLFASIDAVRNFTLSIDSNQFGGMHISAGPSTPLRYWITNTGDETLSVNEFKVSGNTDFTGVGVIETTSGAAAKDFPPGAEKDLFVTFNPSSVGTLMATITADIQGLIAETLTITGTGENYAATLLQHTGGSNIIIDFGSVQYTTYFDLSIPVMNSGTQGDLQVTGATFSGAGNSLFSLASTLPISISPGAQRTVMIRFTPGSTGPKSSASLDLATTDPSNPSFTFPLTGFGAIMQINAPSLSLAFGEQQLIAGPSVSQDFAIQNLGAVGVLTIESITFTDAAFAVASYPSTIDAGATSQAAITFDPSVVGYQSATMTITSRDPAQPQVFVNVSGYGSDADLSIVTLNPVEFGQRHILDEFSDITNILVTNAGTYGTLRINGITREPTNDFAVLAVVTTDLPPDGYLNIGCLFNPSTIGPVETSIVLRTQDFDEQYTTIILKGEGVNPLLLYTWSQADTLQELGAPAIDITLSITNVGTTALHVQSTPTILAGDNAQYYQILSDSGETSIDPQQTRTIVAQFDGLIPGNLTAYLDLVTDDFYNPTYSAPLMGQVFQHLGMARNATQGNIGDAIFWQGYDGFITELRMSIATTAVGLPEDGSLQITLPQGGFNLTQSWAAQVEAIQVPATSANFSYATGTLYLNLSGLGISVSNGDMIDLVVTGVIMPTGSDCYNHPLFRWSIATYHPNGALTEYATNVDLYGDSCSTPPQSNIPVTCAQSVAHEPTNVIRQSEMVNCKIYPLNADNESIAAYSADFVLEAPQGSFVWENTAGTELRFNYVPLDFTLGLSPTITISVRLASNNQLIERFIYHIAGITSAMSSVSCTPALIGWNTPGSSLCTVTARDYQGTNIAAVANDFQLRPTGEGTYTNLVSVDNGLTFTFTFNQTASAGGGVVESFAMVIGHSYPQQFLLIQGGAHLFNQLQVTTGALRMVSHDLNVYVSDFMGQVAAVDSTHPGGEHVDYRIGLGLNSSSSCLPLLNVPWTSGTGTTFSGSTISSNFANQGVQLCFSADSYNYHPMVGFSEFFIQALPEYSIVPRGQLPLAASAIVGVELRVQIIGFAGDVDVQEPDRPTSRDFKVAIYKDSTCTGAELGTTQAKDWTAGQVVTFPGTETAYGDPGAYYVCFSGDGTNLFHLNHADTAPIDTFDMNPYSLCQACAFEDGTLGSSRYRCYTEDGSWFRATNLEGPTAECPV